MDEIDGRTSQVSLEDADVLSRSLAAAVESVFEVRAIRRERAARTLGAWTSTGGIVLDFLGQLKVPSEQAYQFVASRFQTLGYIPLFRKADDQDVIVALPGRLTESRTRPLLATALFFLTLMSVLFVGSTQDTVGGFPDLVSGLPFAASLLGILVAHEAGHYAVSRYFGVPTSLPYFIPMPLSFLGTLGAFIQMKAPPQNKRQLVAIAAAGPTAGLIVALPLLTLGLELSTVEAIPRNVAYMQEGNSLLYAALKIALFGKLLPSNGEDVILHPVALAGWTGLLVTGLNLIPAGQLDGGHIAYALLGGRARWLTWAIIVALLGLSLLWNGWLLWAALVFAFGRNHAIPLDDITSLRAHERALVIMVLLIWALVFTPIPIKVVY